MTDNRRLFIKEAAALTGAFSATSLFNLAHAEESQKAGQKIVHLTDLQATGDEDYWSVI